MSLNAGTQLGPYEILSPLGAGGMGEVYRAKDTKLDREVAIKVLPEVFARDPERVLRFQREAKVLASLNHPNIAAIYGFEEADDQRFLVMELVEGDTLAERLNNRPLSVEESLLINKQITEALETAHESGIIHRDLKPANVKITPEGKVKVLDFGLAKAMSASEDRSQTEMMNSPTITADFTRPGVIMGTAAYMSPEQARGKPIDKRTDIWSFGCVLFESLGGRKPFEGETATDLIAKILERDPEWAQLPHNTPPNVQLLLRRCLTKDRNERLRDIGDARIEITNAIEDPNSSSLHLAGSALAAENRPRKRKASMLMVVCVAILAAVLGSLFTKYNQPEPPLRKFEIPIKDLSTHWRASISPDGMMIAYIADNELWIRDLSDLTPRKLPGTGSARFPFWSPDSQYIGYLTDKQLWKASIHGGAMLVCVLPNSITPVGGASWREDGKIIFATGNSHLYEVSAQGGDPKILHEINPETDEDFHEPSLLPNGKGVLFVIHRRDAGANTIALFDGNESRVLLFANERFRDPIYSPTGHILYHRQITTPGIWAMPFSLSTLKVTGEPFFVMADAFNPRVSSDGSLIYVRGRAAVDMQLIWMDRTGKVLEEICQPQIFMHAPILSRDNKFIAVSARESDNRDIWIHDIERSTKTRFTFSDSQEVLPVWHPDGQQLAYSIGRRIETKWFLKSVDGMGEAKEMGPGEIADFTPDGKIAIVVRTDKETFYDIWAVPLDTKEDAFAIIDRPEDQDRPALSPDGKFLAYRSYESEQRNEIFLTKFPSGEGKWQVSIDGGRNPQWNPTGGELLYVQDNSIYSVSIQTEPKVVLGKPKLLLDGVKISAPFYLGYALSKDGEKILTYKGSGMDGQQEGITVVENWYSEFKDRN